MSNSRPSFPVSRSLGMGNREAGANALANHDLVSPEPLKPKRKRGKQKAGHASVWDSTDRPTVSSVPSLKNDRLCQCKSTAMEALWTSICCSSWVGSGIELLSGRVPEMGMSRNSERTS